MAFWNRVSREIFERCAADADAAIKDAERAFEPWKALHESGLPSSLQEILDDPENPKWKTDDPEKKLATTLFYLLSEATHIRFEIQGEVLRVWSSGEKGPWTRLAQRCDAARKLAKQVVTLAAQHPKPNG